MIPVIVGPTGAGKSRVAHWLAEQFPIAIVSADSRQVYRGFDIGTAKPSADEQAGVPYAGIDVLAPTQRSSAAWWADAAEGWISASVAHGRAPLVVGGTGLYLKAMFAPLFEEPLLDATRRGALEQFLGGVPTDRLRTWVEQLDPPRAHLGRTQLLRAVEIALLTGHRLSDLHSRLARPARRRARYLVVDPGAGLKEDLARRTRAMFDAGWRAEVRGLLASVPLDAPAWNGTGYRTIRALEEGELSEAEAEMRIVIETRQYAKRQRTWFRHQLAGEDVTHVSPVDAGWMDTARAWWDRRA